MKEVLEWMKFGAEWGLESRMWRAISLGCYCQASFKRWSSQASFERWSSQASFRRWSSKADVYPGSSRLPKLASNMLCSTRWSSQASFQPWSSRHVFNRGPPRPVSDTTQFNAILYSAMQYNAPKRHDAIHRRYQSSSSPPSF